MTDGDAVHEGAATPPRHGRWQWALALAAPVVIVALVVAVAVGVTSGDSHRADGGHGSGVGLAAAPLELASVSPQVAEHFTYAADHQSAYRAIPCYCGCEEFLGHHNLYDCFVRSDGKGWDAHAAGCGVCIGESTTARRLITQGMETSAVRDAVVAQFGSTPATTPRRA